MSKALELYEQAIERRRAGDYDGALALADQAQAAAKADEQDYAACANGAFALLIFFLVIMVVAVVAGGVALLSSAL